MRWINPKNLKTISRYCPFKYTYKVYNDTAYKLKFALRRCRWMKWNHLSTGYVPFPHIWNSDGQCNCTLGPGGKTKCFIVLHEAEFLDKIHTKVMKSFLHCYLQPTLKLCLEASISSNSKEKVGKPVENHTSFPMF